jgi:hypothetical protein
MRCGWDSRETAGRILSYLAPLPSYYTDEMVADLVLHKATQRMVDETYQDYMAKIALTMASNCHIENGRDFSDIRKEAYNLSSAKSDSRSAEDIIADTLKKHKMTLKEA